GRSAGPRQERRSAAGAPVTASHAQAPLSGARTLNDGFATVLGRGAKEYIVRVETPDASDAPSDFSIRSREEDPPAAGRGRRTLRSRGGRANATPRLEASHGQASHGQEGPAPPRGRVPRPDAACGGR